MDLLLEGLITGGAYYWRGLLLEGLIIETLFLHGRLIVREVYIVFFKFFLLTTSCFTNRLY